MKNLLNRLTRFMIIMLMLVDRTPFLNVYANNGNGGGNNSGGDLNISEVTLVPAVIEITQSKFEVAADITVVNNWTLDKKVDVNSLSLNLGGSGTVNYTVTVTKTPIYSFKVYFGITLTNKSGGDATFDIVATAADPSGKTPYVVNHLLENDFVLLSGANYSNVYEIPISFDQATFNTISPFKLDVSLTDLKNVASFDTKGQKPAINLKAVNQSEENASVLFEDSLVSSINQTLSDSTTLNYAHLFDAGAEFGSRTERNTVTASVVGSDPKVVIATDFVDVTINTVNRPPMAFDQTVPNFNEDPAAPVSITLTGSDPDGHTLSYTIVSDPAHGTLGGSGSAITYNPHADYNGTDEFTFKVDDGFGGISNVAKVSLNVLPVNDAPVADDETFEIAEDLPFIFTEANLLDGDTDIDGDVLTIISNTNPLIGTLSFNTSTREFTFTPATNSLEEVSFEYTVSDGNGGTDVGRVTFTITPTNDAPEADDKTFTIDEDTTITLTSLDFYSLVTDPEDDLVRVITLTPNFGLDKGKLVYVDPDGDITFEPFKDWFGTVTFDYTVEETSTAEKHTATGTITIIVKTVNDTPVAVNDVFNILEETPLSFTIADLLDNDSDVEGPLNFDDYDMSSVPVAAGTLTLVGTAFTYTPSADYFGSFSFTYSITDGEASDIATVTINVSDVNEKPIATPKTFHVDEDSSLTVTSLDWFENDSDPDNDGFRLGNIVLNFDETKGSFAIDPINDDFTFVPVENFNGSVSFTYTIIDFDSLDPMESEPALVTIIVDPVNDEPNAVDDTYDVDEDEIGGLVKDALEGVLWNDTDIDGDTLKVSLVLGGEPDFGELSLNDDGSFTYIPDKDFSGEDYFTYSIDDNNGGTDVATVKILVNPIEDNPRANPADFNVDEAGILENDVTGFDADGDTFIFELVDDTVYGDLSLDSDGSFKYDHDGSESPNLDQFTFRVKDSNGNYSSSALVKIKINRINDRPTAEDDEVTTDEDVQVAITLVGDDVDSENLSYAILTPPAHGELSGTLPDLTYTPDDDYHGLDSFTFTVTDDGTPALTSDFATVDITVEPINDRPTAEDDDVTTDEDVQVAITLVEMM